MLYVATPSATLGTYVVCPGCLERARENKQCEWTGDTEFLFNSGNPTHQKHLIQDAQLAEELATRFADAARLKVNGVEGHGGLTEDGAVVRACSTSLFAAIETSHRVTAEQIQVARAARNGGFDVAVMLLFVPLYGLGAALVHRGLQRRFASERSVVRWAATAVTSVPAAFLGVQVAGLWSMLWEIIRVGNDHIGGHRLAPFVRPTELHPVGLFVIAILLFWLLDFLHSKPASHAFDFSVPERTLFLR
jgi:hypothetical protein